MQGLPGQTTPEGDAILGYADNSGNIMSSPDGTGTIRGQLPMGGMGGGSTGGKSASDQDSFGGMLGGFGGDGPPAGPQMQAFGASLPGASPMMTAPPTAPGPMAQPGANDQFVRQQCAKGFGPGYIPDIQNKGPNFNGAGLSPGARAQPQAMQGNPNFQGGLRPAPQNYRPPMNSMAGGVLPSGRPGLQQRMQNITPSNYQPAPRTMFQKQMQTQAQPRPTNLFISQGAGGPLIQGFGRR